MLLLTQAGGMRVAIHFVQHVADTPILTTLGVLDVSYRRSFRPSARSSFSRRLRSCSHARLVDVLGDIS